MLTEEIIVLDSKVRAEKHIQKIIVSILNDAGLDPEGTELSRGLPDYFKGMFNHQILDYYCVRFCSVRQLSLSSEYMHLKSKVHEKLRSDILKHIAPTIEFCQSF